MKRYGDVFGVQWYLACLFIAFKMAYTKKHKKEELCRFLDRVIRLSDLAINNGKYGVWQIDHRKALWWASVVGYMLHHQRSMQQARA